jgi:hypothetical protein
MQHAQRTKKNKTETVSHFFPDKQRQTAAFRHARAANGGMPPCKSGKRRNSAMQERQTAEFRHARAENSGIPLSAILRQILHILFY